MVGEITREADFDGRVYETNMAYIFARVRLLQRKLRVERVEATVRPFLSAAVSFERTTFPCRRRHAQAAHRCAASQTLAKAQQYAWVVLPASTVQ